MSDHDSNPTNALGLSRRALLAAASGVASLALPAARPVQAAIVNTDFRNLPPYGSGTLPAGVRARLIPNVNGLTVNILEAGFDTPGRPLVLMLHGFPNLAYSWRKVMPALAAAGYYVVAPDCRGFGRTTGWDDSFDADPQPFLALNLVRDQIALVYALGYRTTAMMVGTTKARSWPPWAHLSGLTCFRCSRSSAGVSVAPHRSHSIRPTALPCRGPILP